MSDRKAPPPERRIPGYAFVLLLVAILGAAALTITQCSEGGF